MGCFFIYFYFLLPSSFVGVCNMCRRLNFCTLRRLLFFFSLCFIWRSVGLHGLSYCGWRSLELYGMMIVCAA